jgi:hypothetical protein
MQAPPKKIYYIDNLRVLMTVLVVMHHTLIAYGAPGGWYFADATQNKPALIVMTLLVATNQSFFMGFFFFLAAYFTEPSYNKKRSTQFLKDRLKRLGIPLLFYSFILGPFMNFLIYRYGLHKQASFTQYLAGYDDWIDFGVLWFVAALLLFTLAYVIYRKYILTPMPAAKPFPPHTSILVFALTLGLISYLVRILFPIGWVLKPLGFQPAHFTQYISLFIYGIIAWRNQWFEKLSFQENKRWIYVSLLMVMVVFPAMFILMNSPIEKFLGNGTWQSLVVALWEQLTGIAIMVALSGIAKQRWNFSNSLVKNMSRAAFATYILHPLVVITFTLLLLPWKVDPVYKLLIALPCSIVFSFCLGWLVSKLPLVKEVV